jgi:hypothetical protein
MTGQDVSTRILSASLEPDGTIRLLLVFAGCQTPEIALIEPLETTIRAAGPQARAVDLAPGAERDRHLRLIVAMHADALAYEREQRADQPRLAG